jgi:hypothetical protein
MQKFFSIAIFLLAAQFSFGQNTKASECDVNMVYVKVEKAPKLLDSLAVLENLISDTLRSLKKESEVTGNISFTYFLRCDGLLESFKSDSTDIPAALTDKITNTLKPVIRFSPAMHNDRKVNYRGHFILVMDKGRAKLSYE